MAWKILILTASAVFYGYWDWRFLGLLALMILVNEVAAVAVHRQPEPVRRKRLTGTAVVFDLAVLGVFKYYGFFVASLEDSFGLEGPALDIVLPVGVSFFTFQAISYVVDVHRQEATRRRCSISPCTSHSSPSLSLGRSSGPRSSFRSPGEPDAGPSRSKPSDTVDCARSRQEGRDRGLHRPGNRQ